MRTLGRIGLFTTAGLGLVTVALGAWLLQLVRAPRLPYRSDCHMAWSTIVEPDIFITAAAGLLGVLVGATFWGRSGDWTLGTAVHPGRIVLTVYVAVLGSMTLGSLPAVALVEVMVWRAGGQPCFSAAALHLLAVLGFGLAVGMTAARWLNPLLAAVVALAVLGLLYAAVPSLTQDKLLNVGVTPLPMMDQRRSWAYAAVMAAALCLGSAALLWSVVNRRHVASSAAGMALAVGVVLLPGPRDFVAYQAEARTCRRISAAKQVCLPVSYSWMALGVRERADRMLSQAVAEGVDPTRLPRRFELGQFASTSDPGTAQMTLSSGFISDGRVPPVEVAGLLVSPSWCAGMRRSDPPAALLRQTGAMAVWFAVQGGYVTARDAANMVPQDLVDPASLTASDINAGLTAASACRAATWVR